MVARLLDVVAVVVVAVAVAGDVVGAADDDELTGGTLPDAVVVVFTAGAEVAELPGEVDGTTEAAVVLTCVTGRIGIAVRPALDAVVEPAEVGFSPGTVT